MHSKQYQPSQDTPLEQGALDSGIDAPQIQVVQDKPTSLPILGSRKRCGQVFFVAGLLGLTAIGSGLSASYLSQKGMASGEIVASNQDQGRQPMMLAEEIEPRSLEEAKADTEAGVKVVIDEEARARAAARTALATADVKLAESEYNAAAAKRDSAEKIAKLAVDAAVYAGQEADAKKKEYENAKADPNFQQTQTASLQYDAQQTQTAAFNKSKAAKEALNDLETAKKELKEAEFKVQLALRAQREAAEEETTAGTRKVRTGGTSGFGGCSCDPEEEFSLQEKYTELQRQFYNLKLEKQALEKGLSSGAIQQAITDADDEGSQCPEHQILDFSGRRCINPTCPSNSYVTKSGDCERCPKFMVGDKDNLQRECVVAKCDNAIPGSHIAMKGLNLFQGDYKELPPNSMYQLSCSLDRTTTARWGTLNNGYDVPDQYKAEPLLVPECNTQVRMSQFHTASSSEALMDMFQADSQGFEHNWAFDSQFDLGPAAAQMQTSIDLEFLLGNSRKARYLEKLSTSKKTLSASIRGKSTAYEAFLDTSTVSEEFVEAFKKVQDIDAAFQFYKEYGTHYLEKVEFGAQFGQTLSITEETRAAEKSKLVQTIKSKKLDLWLYRFDDKSGFRSEDQELNEMMSKVALSTMENEGSIDGSNLEACKGLGSKLNPTVTSFTPKHMWKLFEEREDEELKGAVGAFKDFDRKFFQAANECSERNCNGNGACRVHLDLWKSADTQIQDFRQFFMPICRCNQETRDGLAVNPKRNCEPCPAASEYSRISENGECVDKRIQNNDKIFTYLPGNLPDTTVPKWMMTTTDMVENPRVKYTTEKGEKRSAHTVTTVDGSQYLRHGSLIKMQTDSPSSTAGSAYSYVDCVLGAVRYDSVGVSYSSSTSFTRFYWEDVYGSQQSRDYGDVKAAVRAYYQMSSEDAPGGKLVVSNHEVIKMDDPRPTDGWGNAQVFGLLTLAAKQGVFGKEGCNTADCSDYRGKQTRTTSGRACQPWEHDRAPHHHHYTPAEAPGKGLTQNYCRNPDAAKNIWCYTTDPRKKWEYCAPLALGAKNTEAQWQLLKTEDTGSEYLLEGDAFELVNAYDGYNTGKVMGYGAEGSFLGSVAETLFGTGTLFCEMDSNSGSDFSHFSFYK